MSAHLGDDIELYALGDLSPEERASVEAHLATCEECTRALGESEGTLAELADLLPAYRAPRRVRSTISAARRGAIAAAFVAGLLAAGITLAFVNFSGGPNNEDLRAQVAMTHSHFDHVTLTSLGAGAPAAKVIYAHDRSWLYAIVDDGRSGYRLVAVGGTHPVDLGSLAAHSASASLFVERPPPVHDVELVLGDRVLARGMLR